MAGAFHCTSLLLDDTIVAISTPPGRGAIGVVRISGEDAHQIVRDLCPRHQGKFEENRATLVRVCNPKTSEVIDEAIATFFRKPRSFTGEDTVELSCHGSRIVLSEVISAAIKLGARAAQPGEFSLRAVVNGKMDLTQAEAVRDLIDATTHWQAKVAVQQLHGSLSKRLSPLKRRLVDLIVHLESAVEFVEEDVPTSSLSGVAGQIRSLVTELERINHSFELGRRIREGVRVAIIGRPNVGKSSIFNALLQRERAIVTNIPGTTRDTVSETIELGNIPVTLFDTAGLREATDHVEQIGVERSYSAIAEADALLVITDASEPFGEEDIKLLREQRERAHLIVLNKWDLTCGGTRPSGLGEADWERAIRVSAKSGDGLDQLAATLVELLGSGTALGEGDAILTNARHHGLIVQAEASLRESIDAIEKGFTEEVALVGMHAALQRLGEITGETLIDDILGQIFATFCIGK